MLCFHSLSGQNNPDPIWGPTGPSCVLAGVVLTLARLAQTRISCCPGVTEALASSIRVQIVGFGGVSSEDSTSQVTRPPESTLDPPPYREGPATNTTGTLPPGIWFHKHACCPHSQ